ncbi:MAG: L-threonylcarbamoyladenylate synthase [Pseudomonadota bacterium]
MAGPVIRPDATGLRAAGDLVAAGGVVLYPTDTLYGMGGDATQGTVARRILTIKGIAGPRPFPILVPSLEVARAATAARTRPALEVLARAAWPGALTLVVPLQPDAARRLAPAAPMGTAGFRMPAHPAARYLAARVGGYLIGTSANLAGAPPPADPDALDPALVAAADAWIDAAPPCAGLASTVLDLTGDGPVVLRAGELDLARLLALLEGAGP